MINKVKFPNFNNISINIKCHVYGHEREHVILNGLYITLCKNCGTVLANLGRFYPDAIPPTSNENIVTKNKNDGLSLISCIVAICLGIFLSFTWS